jgi:hypothetical protein
MAQKVTIEHRPFRMPSPELCDPKLTHRKIEHGICRMCGRDHRVRPLTRHHLVPHSWFLKQPLALKLIRNAHANIIPLCRPCHDLVDARAELDRVDARRMLRRSLAQDEIAFAIQVRGRQWLDYHYPAI